MSVFVDLIINHPEWEDIGIDPDDFAQDVVSLTLKRAKLPNEMIDRDMEVCIVLTNDAEIHALNRDYRGMDKPTNVLSFATLDSDEDVPEDIPYPLGDVIIAWETMKREALEQDKEFLDHLRHMMVHGTLHLIGYDHLDDAEAAEMEGLEIEILKEMNVENPYAETDFV